MSVNFTHVLDKSRRRFPGNETAARVVAAPPVGEAVEDPDNENDLPIALLMFRTSSTLLDENDEFVNLD